MDTVINQISSIESAATSIMDDANIRKKEFAKEIDDKMNAFDSLVDAETAKKLEELKSKMEVEMNEKLSAQQSGAENILKTMEEHYHQSHDLLVKELFQSMVGE